MIFSKVCHRKEGHITYEEYLRWVKFYLAVEANRGEEFYSQEDDESIAGGELLDKEKITDVLPDIRLNKVNNKAVFYFSSYDLSKKVRQRVWDLLIPFDTNRN